MIAVKAQRALKGQYTREYMKDLKNRDIFDRLSDVIHIAKVDLALLYLLDYCSIGNDEPEQKKAKKNKVLELMKEVEEFSEKSAEDHVVLSSRKETIEDFIEICQLTMKSSG